MTNKDEKEQELRKMGLHQITHEPVTAAHNGTFVCNVEILRVPGGWIYYYDGNRSVFVPAEIL